MKSVEPLPKDFLIAAGRVVEAFRNRAHRRRCAFSAKAAVETARESHRWFGGYEDCGSFYETQLAIAEAEFQTAVSEKIAAEKRYKALRLALLQGWESIPNASTILDDLCAVERERIEEERR